MWTWANNLAVFQVFLLGENGSFFLHLPPSRGICAIRGTVRVVPPPPPAVFLSVHKVFPFWCGSGGPPFPSHRLRRAPRRGERKKHPRWRASTTPRCRIRAHRVSRCRRNTPHLDASHVGTLFSLPPSFPGEREARGTFFSEATVRRGRAVRKWHGENFFMQKWTWEKHGSARIWIGRTLTEKLSEETFF